MPEGLERGRGLLVGLTVVDHDREPELLRELELCVEQAPLLAGVAYRRTVSSPVSPTATAFGWASSSRSSSTRPASEVPDWCGSMPSAANTPS